MSGILAGLFWFVFVVSALFLMLIILIQEGKGGGLAEAFGGQGAETFGVKATGVNRVTAILAITFMLSAIFINKLNHRSGDLMGSAAPAEAVELGDGAGTIGTPPEDSGDGGN